MNITIATKLLKLAPLADRMAGWQRGSRPLGIVGLKH